MNTKSCKFCNKIFSTRWNLERHLKDIHKVLPKQENNNINSEIDNYHYSSQGYNNSNRNFSHRNNYNEMNQINYSGNYNDCNQIPQNYSYPGYYFDIDYPWSNIYPKPEKEQKTWTCDDQLLLQRGLKILQNHLEKLYHPFYVSRFIFMLKRKCN